MNTLYSCLITENYVFIWYKLKWSANYSFAVYLRFNLDYIVFYLINLDRQLVKQSNFRLTSVFESENGKKNSWDFRYADYSVLHRLQCLSRAGTTWSLSTASMKHNHGNYSHTILYNSLIVLYRNPTSSSCDISSPRTLHTRWNGMASGSSLESNYAAFSFPRIFTVLRVSQNSQGYRMIAEKWNCCFTRRWSWSQQRPYIRRRGADAPCCMSPSAGSSIFFMRKKKTFANNICYFCTVYWEVCILYYYNIHKERNIEKMRSRRIHFIVY